MRALICGLIALLVPALASAEIIQFTFTGVIDSDPPYFESTWNGPGPQPTTLQMSFDVNTLSPGNSLNYTFYNSPDSSVGPTIGSINADLVTTNVTIGLDGKTVLSGPTGTFAFSAEPLGGALYIGGTFGVGVPGATFGMIPDIAFGTNTQAALIGASDPLGLLLNHSAFYSDNGGGPYSFLSYDNSQLFTTLGGTGTAVPEPSAPALFSLAFVGLLLVHRRRRIS